MMAEGLAWWREVVARWREHFWWYYDPEWSPVTREVLKLGFYGGCVVGFILMYGAMS